MAWRSLFAKQPDLAASSRAPTPAQPEPSDAWPIHLLDPDCQASLADGRIRICRPEHETVMRRLDTVSGLTIHGEARVSTPLVAELLARKIPIIWRSRSGYWLGSAVPPSVSGLAARRRQLACPALLKLDVAKALVARKIKLQRDVLRRRRRNARSRVRLKLQAAAALNAESPQSLRGIEGAAAREYWRGFAAVVGDRGHDFAKRAARPVPDVINALLSYLYALLVGECAIALTVAGLDPAAGLFHADRAGRPALALDLMEPFRPGIVDSVVAGLARRSPREWRAFLEEESVGVRLNRDGRRMVLRAYEKRLESAARLDAGGATSWRSAIWRAAGALSQSLRSNQLRLALPRST